VKQALLKEHVLDLFLVHFLQVKQPYPTTEWFYASNSRIRTMEAWFKENWDQRQISDQDFATFLKELRLFFLLPVSHTNKTKAIRKSLSEAKPKVDSKEQQ
jgi:hypothetical protein